MTTGTDTIQKTTVDTWSDKAHTTTNHGGQAFISVNGDGTNTRYGYVHFARPFQLGATVFSATLQLHLLEIGTEWNSGPHTVTARRVTEAWGEYMLNWSNAPATVALHEATGSVTGGSDGDLLEIDVTDMMNDVSAGSDWFGIRLEVDTTGNKSFYAAENPNQTYRAALDIDWGVEPHAPVNLNPIGNQSVSVSQPVLDWQFASPDHTATRRQSYSQVQVNSTSDMSSPTYDSGWMANTNSQWDLSAATSPTFTALSDGATFYWRVRVKDDQGLASDWTEVARAQRNSKGTLTMSYPAASPSNTVDDLTPEIDWSFASRTQQAFELRLYHYNGTNLSLTWRLPKVVSTATAYTIPKGYIKTGEAYRIVLLVWDTIDRAVTPGDNDWVTLGRDFSYARDGTPAPVTNLTATNTPPNPSVVMTWQRSTAPDYFCLKVNNKEVLSRINPSDVFQSGTTYGMTFWRATPRLSSTYEVEAVVDDGSPFHRLINSDGNDTKTLTTDPTKIHLIDEDDGTHLVITGNADPDFSIREVGTTYDLQGSRIPVRINDSIAGYAGTVSGQLQSSGQRDTFLTLKGRSPKPFRLVVGDSNMSVVLEEGGVAPTTIPDDALYNVSFSYFQVDADETFDVTG